MLQSFRTHFKRGIARKIIRLLFIFGIIPMGILSVLFFMLYFRGLKQSVFQIQKEISNRISVSISGYLDKTLSQIQLFAGITDLSNTDIAKLNTQLHWLLDQVVEFDSLTFADLEGNELIKVSRYYSFRPFELKNISSHDAFRTAADDKKIYISDVGISEYSQFPFIKIALPIYNLRNDAAGVFIAEVNFSRMWHLISQRDTGENRYAYIVDSKGNLIAYQETSLLLGKRNAADIDGVRRFLSKEYGVSEYRGLNQKTVIGATAVIPLTGWGVIAEEPLNAAFLKLYFLSVTLCVLFFLTLLFAMILGIRFSLTQIIRPIRILQNEAEYMSQGHFDRRINVQTDDELGRLSETFNKMASNLEKTTVSRDDLIREIEERKLAEAALRESEVRYRMIFENSPLGIIQFSEDGVIEDCNHAFAEIIGASKNTLIGFNMISSMPDCPARKAVEDTIRTGSGSFEGDYHTVTGNRKIVIRADHKRITGDDGKFLAAIGVFEDISAKKRLEMQFLQAQKMEAIGTLAGGIAHDFNNLLMGIQGYVSLCLLEVNESDPVYKRLMNIEKSVGRGSELTGRLLGFARGGKYEIKPANLNELLREQCFLFSRTKKEITVHEDYADDLSVVEADQGQIEQVILNLLINSSHAMPDGGAIYIQTKNTILDQHYIKPYKIRHGPYVRISVTDTGVGIDPEIQQKIFEPFFTTKPIGSGTGLGLASVYGIVKNHAGFINVYSEKNVGTTFNIYLPASEKSVVPEHHLKKSVSAGGTILLTDDEKQILDVGKELLERSGYTVIPASGGKEAVEAYRNNHHLIDAVILDMIMPGTNGAEVVDRLKEINPRVKIILSSGYSLNGRATEILGKGCAGFIQKPFSVDELNTKIQEAEEKNIAAII